MFASQLGLSDRHLHPDTMYAGKEAVLEVLLQSQLYYISSIHVILWNIFPKFLTYRIPMFVTQKLPLF